MKRAKAAEILAGFFEADVLAHHADNVRLLFHFIRNGSRFRHFILLSLITAWRNHFCTQPRPS